MGHVRLGKSPATRKWKEVVGLLGAADVSVADIANAVEKAADRTLREAVNDPGFVEAIWLFLKMPLAARSADFIGELLKLGIKAPETPTLTDLLVGIDAAVEKARRRGGRAVTDFSLIAKNAAIAALQSVTANHSPSLWKSTPEDVRTTLAAFAGTERFGELAQRFFTNVLDGHIQYFLDREIPRHVGAGSFVRSVADTGYFDGAVMRHCTETTVIMRAFAKDWLGNNRYHLERDLTREAAAGFAAHAFTKIRTELSFRSGA